MIGQGWMYAKKLQLYSLRGELFVKHFTKTVILKRKHTKLFKTFLKQIPGYILGSELWILILTSEP